MHPDTAYLVTRAMVNRGLSYLESIAGQVGTVSDWETRIDLTRVRNGAVEDSVIDHGRPGVRRGRAGACGSMTCPAGPTAWASGRWSTDPGTPTIPHPHPIPPSTLRSDRMYDYDEGLEPLTNPTGEGRY